METKQIVKALKQEGLYIVQFKNNFDSKRNHYIEENGIPKRFESEREAIEYAKTQLPKWMFV